MARGANSTVVVDFIANTADLVRGTQAAASSGKGIGGTLKNIGKAGVLAAGAAGIGALVVGLKMGIDEFESASKVGAQTNAVLKSTGGAAGVTAGKVGDLATAIMRKSGMDDEAIQSGENLLLTFTNIKDAAGRGNDIFSQTTSIMADMATAMGTSPQQTAIQLGKALNDPVKGITALSRVGVSFTKGQKDQIGAMVKAGDTMGAQKLILAELNKEFGGSAKAVGDTLPGKINIAKETLSNFAGEIVGKAIPVLEKMVGFVIDHWPEISAVFDQVWKTIRPVLVALGDLVVSVVGLVVDNWGTIGPVVQAVQNYIAAALKVVGDVIRLFAAILRGDWSAAWSAVLAIIRDVWGLIVAYVKMVLAELKAILQAAWAVIKAAASAVWNGILAVVSGVWDLIRSVVYQGASALGSTLSGAWSSIKSGVSSAWNAVKSTISGAVDGIGNTVDRIADKIGGVVGAVRSAAGRVASAILSPINSVIRAWNGLAFSVPKVSFPGVSIMGRQIVPGFGFGPYRFDFPNLPELARGGVVNAPTLALLGEGSGREIVAPEALLREIIADGGGGGSYTLNVYARRADAQDVAYGFRRLELLRTGR